MDGGTENLTQPVADLTDTRAGDQSSGKTAARGAQSGTERRRRAYPVWRRCFGVASILVAIGTVVLVAWFAWESWLNALLYLALKSMAGEDTGQVLPALLLRRTLWGWVSGVSVSMLCLLIAGISAVAGRRASWALHRLAAGMILLATLGTFIVLSIWIHYGAAEPQPPKTYAWLAIGQSAWAWISLAAFGRHVESAARPEGDES